MKKEYQDIGDPAIHLIEECSELIKCICKGERFGWNKCHPDRPHSSNIIELISEFEDIHSAYTKLINKIQNRKG